MLNLESEQVKQLLEKAIEKLEPLGWMHMGEFLFFKGGKIYDLSAADLDKIELIEEKGLFVVAE
jgi:hypothetical protein